MLDEQCSLQLEFDLVMQKTKLALANKAHDLATDGGTANAHLAVDLFERLTTCDNASMLVTGQRTLEEIENRVEEIEAKTAKKPSAKKTKKT